MIIGYTSGIFDLFHQGHITYLESCKLFCDFLIVGIDSNDRTKKIKGNERPINDISIRISNVSKYCNHTLEKVENSSSYINKFRPDVIFRSEGKSLNIQNKNIKIIYIPYSYGISTSLLISLNKMQE